MGNNKAEIPSSQLVGYSGTHITSQEFRDSEFHISRDNMEIEAAADVSTGQGPTVERYLRGPQVGNEVRCTTRLRMTRH
jgi:hypothetical protein